MVGLLDSIALIVVAAAVIFLVRRSRQPRCGAHERGKAKVEARIPLAQLRASVRRAAGRR
jgi:hypothetical protein